MPDRAVTEKTLTALELLRTLIHVDHDEVPVNAALFAVVSLSDLANVEAELTRLADLAVEQAEELSEARTYTEYLEYQLDRERECA